MLNKEKLNYIEKILFLETEHKCLLKRNSTLTQEIEPQRKVVSSKHEIFHYGTKILNEIIDKYKSHGDKKGLGYINNIETPTSKQTIFVKRKKETPNPIAFSSIPP